MEAWECDTSPSSGKSCGGTCGHFWGWELFLSDSDFIPQEAARGGDMILPNAVAGSEVACGCVGDWGPYGWRVIQILAP